MFRIDHVTADASLPTPEALGTEGYFKKGNPATATPATVVTADWANAVQEEIMFVIEEAGLASDKTDNTLLKQAIDALIAAAVSGSDLLPTGHRNGLTLSNGTDTTNDINIAAGKAKASSDDFDITVTTAIGKQIDQPWAAGGTTGAPTGGFPSGISLTNNTWYRVFLIAKPDGTVGAGFDTSSTAVNLLADATGYTKYRHIGWVRRGVGTNLQFVQVGSSFEFDTPVADFLAATLASTTESKTLTVPPSTIANVSFRGDSGSGTVYYRLYQTSMTSAAASSSNMDFVAYVSGSPEFDASGRASVKTDASSQIKVSANSTGANCPFTIITRGWTDPEI